MATELEAQVSQTNLSVEDPDELLTVIHVTNLVPVSVLPISNLFAAARKPDTMRLVVLLLAWTAVPVATAALALTPNLMFNLSFTDMTGFVRYAEAPGTQNSPPKYWNTSFFNPSGTGDSRHSTTSLNASFLEMYYIGTGIDVYGRFLSDTNGTNWVNFGELGSSYNATPGSQLGVLGSMRDLSWKDHFFSLSLENAAPNPGATLYVHGFTITTGMKTQA